MADVSQDQLVVIKIDGMHCHKCERTIQSNLSAIDGVNEVEVDFASGQASVLYDHNRASIKQLMETIDEAGYRANGFVQNSPDSDRAMK
ncbi:MAG: heavy-metal-associated domain-containing protein [Phycisphaerae bacterium]|nr:heavy-metal-associated domain-containing protein [Phycisphaerae bacterium]